MPLVPEPNAAEDATQDAELSEFVQQQRLVNFLQEAVEFASIFDQALPVVCTLLGSKQVWNDKRFSLLVLDYQLLS